MSVQPDPNRWHNLDTLRGFVVLLAFLQHYSGYLNDWYINFFREGPALDAGYQVHADYLGRILPADPILTWLAQIFVPWVSMAFIALAAFNLSRRSQADFVPVYGQKLQVFLILALFFLGEQAVCSLNFGHAVSVYPLPVWMLLLALIATLYRFAGLTGVMVLFGLTLLQYLLPIGDWERAGEAWVQAQVHPGFRYQASVLLFALPASLGFLLGWAWFHRPAWRERLPWALALALLATGVGLVFGDPMTADPRNVFANEHAAAQPMNGLAIFAWISFVVLLALGLEQRGWGRPVPMLTWLGVHSLLVFGLHRILFIYLWMPWREWLGAKWNWPLSNNVYEVAAFAALTLAATALLLRSRLLSMLEHRPR